MPVTTVLKSGGKLACSRKLQASRHVSRVFVITNPRLELASLQVTHWLREIGGINSNSFNRFSKLPDFYAYPHANRHLVKEKGRTDGASNGTYYPGCVPLLAMMHHCQR